MSFDLYTARWASRQAATDMLCWLLVTRVSSWIDSIGCNEGLPFGKVSTAIEEAVNQKHYKPEVPVPERENAALVFMNFSRLDAGNSAMLPVGDSRVAEGPTRESGVVPYHFCQYVSNLPACTLVIPSQTCAICA
jgi:hypothetical protein